MKINLKKSVATLLFFSAITHAESNDHLNFSSGAVTQGINKVNDIGVNKAMSSFEGVVPLPIKTLRAVKKDGEVRFFSDNGRFVITGKIYDLWYKKELTSFEEIEYSARRIDFGLMNLSLDDLGAETIGTGDKEVALFVDPKCQYCHQLIKTIRDNDKLKNEYSFKIIVVPALGEQSNALGKIYSCAEDKSLKLDALVNHKIPSLKPMKNCDLKKYEDAILMSHLIGISGVPYMVSDKGRIGRGIPKDLDAWLKELI